MVVVVVVVVAVVVVLTGGPRLHVFGALQLTRGECHGVIDPGPTRGVATRRTQWG
jgi:hypothetical protein